MIGGPIMTSVGEASKSLQMGQRGMVILRRGDGRLSHRFFGGEGSELEVRFGDATHLPFVAAAYNNATGTTERGGEEGSMGAVLA